MSPVTRTASGGVGSRLRCSTQRASRPYVSSAPNSRLPARRTCMSEIWAITMRCPFAGLLEDLVDPLLPVREDGPDGLAGGQRRLERGRDGPLHLDDVLHRQLGQRVLELLARGEGLGVLG